MSTLSERAVLMKFSAGLPGKHRKDKTTTADVKAQKALGDESGNWVADLWPKDALKAVSTVQGEARKYHDTVTFPFGARSEDEEESNGNGESKSAPAIAGIGILPAVLIQEYSDKMREFAARMEKVTEETFLADPQSLINWAVKQHNGTFNPKNYPGVFQDEYGNWKVSAEAFRQKMRKKIYMRTEPLPVPDRQQFTAQVSALLGNDAASVDLRIADATVEAQRELMRRMIQPVTHMAHRLANKPCPCSDCKGKSMKTDAFKSSLVKNVADIVTLGPKLNIMGDPTIDTFLREMDGLTRYTFEGLRDDETLRTEAAAKAAATLERLSGYKL